MSLTRLVKSNHGTFGDQCPSKEKKIPPKSPIACLDEQKLEAKLGAKLC